jgi:hypothetical protein
MTKPSRKPDLPFVSLRYPKLVLMPIQRRNNALQRLAKETAWSVKQRYWQVSKDLDTWLSDQVQHGMANFIAQTAQVCRTIAQRLVDAKAPGLAGRLDALPTRLFTLPGPARPSAAIRELGQVHLLGLEQMSLILPNLLGPELVRWLVKMLRKIADDANVGSCGTMGVITTLDFFQYLFA